MKRTITPLPKLILLLFVFINTCFSLQAQYASKIFNPYHAHYHDSLKAMNFPYTFPLLAKGGYKKGYDIPFAFGIGSAYYTQRQDITIKRTLVGLNDGQQVDVGQFIQFGQIENVTTAVTVRPDMWVLPFLNVYGVFGVGNSETAVSLERPVNFKTTQKFDVSSVGCGVTLAGGLGPVFLVLDNNISFANIDALEDRAKAYNLDIRVGHNFTAPTRADRGLAIWFGTFYQHINGDTKGKIAIKDLLPNGAGGLEDNFIDRLEEWADGLPPAQQIVANQVINKIDNYLDGLDLGDDEISYGLDKEITKPWNLIFGAQYQHNKHWQFRTEVGTYGRRTSFLLMANYRFEHIGKKKKH